MWRREATMATRTLEDCWDEELETMIEKGEDEARNRTPEPGTSSDEEKE